MSPSLPSGPKGNWLDTIARQIAGKPPRVQSLDDFRELARPFDGIMYYRVAIFDVYIVWSPELIHGSIVEQPFRFGKGYVVQRAFGRLIGKGLLSSDGDFWKRQRKLAQPAFHTKRVETYAQTMVDLARRMLDSWQGKQQINVPDEMGKVTMQVAAKTLFDVDVTDETTHIAQTVKTLVEIIFTMANNLLIIPEWIPTPHNRRLNKALEQIDTIIYGIIADRRNRTVNGEVQDKGDLLSMFMLARDDDGQPMSDKQLRDELVTAFFAGHETTSLALTWAFYALSQHPDITAKLRMEVLHVLGDRPATLADLPQLTYTGQVIKETLRHYPPLPLFPRQVMEETEVNGYLFKKNAVVAFAPFITHHDSRWYPDPETFLPERWTPEFEASLPKYAWFPFGGGPRVCIGNSFAMLEARLILATVVQHFQLDLVPGQTIQPTSFLSMRPKYGMAMQIVPVET